MARDGTVVVRILGDASSAQRAFRDTASASQSLGQKLKSAIGPAVIAGGTAALVSFGKGAVAAFGEARKVTAQTEAALKSTGGAAGVTGGQIGDLANKLKRLSGVEDETIQSGQNMLLTFTNIKNGVGAGNQIFDKATKTMLDMSVALGQDTKSSAIQLGKALNDPIRGVSALQRVGVTFTQQQKDQIRALVESGRTMDAQKVILAELNKEFGGSAAAQGAALGPGEKLRLAWGDLQEQVGSALVPALQKLAEMLSGLINWFSQLSPGMKTAIGVAAGLAGAVFVVVKAIQAWTAVQAALNVVLAANPIGLVILAVAALAAGLVIAYRNSGTFRNVVDGAFRVVKGAIEAVSRVFGPLLEVFKSNWGLILAPLTGGLSLLFQHFDKVRDIVKSLLDWLKKIPAAVDKALGPLDELIGKVGSLPGAAGGALDKVLPGRGLIPKLHSGGVFRARMPGGEGFALLKDGETILPTHRGPQGGSAVYNTWNVTGSSPYETAIMIESRVRLANLVA